MNEINVELSLHKKELAERFVSALKPVVDVVVAQMLEEIPELSNYETALTITATNYIGEYIKVLKQNLLNPLIQDYAIDLLDDQDDE